MTASAGHSVTQLLLNWRQGDAAALDELVPVVYQKLRRLARHYMAGQKPGHTLQATALVNEAYVRLIDCKQVNWKDRARSEEHTSELQSLRHLVCRLLLEKK